MFSATRLGVVVSRCLTHRSCDIIIREKHSSTQLKRLFQRNPARFRVAKRQGWIPEPQMIPPPKFPPILEPMILPNGWSVPAGPEITVPTYPFQVHRTKNKPHDAVGFLPVYSEFRYVTEHLEPTFFPLWYCIGCRLTFFFISTL